GADGNARGTVSVGDDGSDDRVARRIYDCNSARDFTSDIGTAAIRTDCNSIRSCADRDISSDRIAGRIDYRNVIAGKVSDIGTAAIGTERNGVSARTYRYGSGDRVGGRADDRNNPALVSYINECSIRANCGTIATCRRNGRDDRVVRYVDNRKSVVGEVRHIKIYWPSTHGHVATVLQ